MHVHKDGTSTVEKRRVKHAALWCESDDLKAVEQQVEGSYGSTWKGKGRNREDAMV